MPGRKPKPPALRALTGGKTTGRGTAAPSQFTAGPPGWLSAKATRHWHRLVEIVAPMGHACNADALALAMLAEALTDWQDAAEAVAEHGAFYECQTEAGATMHRQHPAVAARADAARRVQSLLSEFGLTPAARAKVGPIIADDPTDPAQRYFT